MKRLVEPRELDPVRQLIRTSDKRPCVAVVTLFDDGSYNVNVVHNDKFGHQHSRHGTGPTMARAISKLRRMEWMRVAFCPHPDVLLAVAGTTSGRQIASRLKRLSHWLSEEARVLAGGRQPRRRRPKP